MSKGVWTVLLSRRDRDPCGFQSCIDHGVDRYRQHGLARAVQLQEHVLGVRVRPGVAQVVNECFTNIVEQGKRQDPARLLLDELDAVLLPCSSTLLPQGSFFCLSRMVRQMFQ